MSPERALRPTGQPRRGAVGMNTNHSQNPCGSGEEALVSRRWPLCVDPLDEARAVKSGGGPVRVAPPRRYSERQQRPFFA